MFSKLKYYFLLLKVVSLYHRKSDVFNIGSITFIYTIIMKAKYIKKEMPDMLKTGTTKVYFLKPVGYVVSSYLVLLKPVVTSAGCYVH